jgi:hypothetical protein
MEERERFTAYISMYALSGGIQEVEVEDCFHISPTMVSGPSQCYHKDQWHRTKEEAIARAEGMRKRKIASLEKSIEKMRKLKF